MIYDKWVAANNKRAEALDNLVNGLEEYVWRATQEQLQQAPVYTSTLVAPGHFNYLYLPEEKANIKYIPPIVDDAGIDIYNRMPEHVKQEIRDNIWKYLEQVQRDYPPEPRVEAT
jgi:hypothetical protein